MEAKRELSYTAELAEQRSEGTGTPETFSAVKEGAQVTLHILERSFTQGGNYELIIDVRADEEDLSKLGSVTIDVVEE